MFALAVPAAAQSDNAQIARDPVTGKLRAPSAEQKKALQDKAAARQAGTPRAGLLSGAPVTGPVRRADGSVELELDDSTLSHAVMERRADGSLAMRCVTAPSTAAALRSPSAAMASTGEHDHADR